MATVAEPSRILHPTPNHSSPQYSSTDVSIEATPSFEKYIKRRDLLLTSNRRGLYEPLPAGFPEFAESPATWSSETLRYEDLLYTLSDQEVAEVESALDFFKGMYKVDDLFLFFFFGLDSMLIPTASSTNLNDISTTTFPLPCFGPKLRSFSDEIYFGRGAAALRGLGPDKYSPFDNTVIFAGISSHVAAERGVQSKFGDYLGEAESKLHCSCSSSFVC